MVDRLEPPPRRTGDDSSDIAALNDYVWAMYQNLILEKGVPQTVDQPDLIDPGTGVITSFPIGYLLFTSIATDPATYLGYGTWERRAQGRAIVGVDEDDLDFATAGLELGAKTHTLTEAEMPSHTHVQDAHTHVQNSHNHTQDAHNHTQDAHAHAQQVVNSANDGTAGVRGSSDANTTGDGNTASVAATNQATVATNQAATAVNQNATATNQSTGGGAAHSIVQPSFTCFVFERTA